MLFRSAPAISAPLNAATRTVNERSLIITTPNPEMEGSPQMRDRKVDPVGRSGKGLAPIDVTLALRR